LIDYNKHIILSTSQVKDALLQINDLEDRNHMTLFVVDAAGKLIGTLTDGDVRRGLLNELTLNDLVTSFMRDSFRHLKEGDINADSLLEFNDLQISLIPVLDNEGKVLRVMDLSKEKSFLPIDVVIMAGGKGMRLRPLTEKLPKPLLEIGGTPIIERNVIRLQACGVQHINITVNYLGDLLKEHFKSSEVKCLTEESFLGTIGSVNLVDSFKNDTVLVMNSDLLTNIDFVDFHSYFESTNADMLIASIPYEVNVPYAVLEDKDGRIVSLQEKPTYTYYSNAGIYLIKRSLLELIPKDEKYDATDLIERLIEDDKNVVSYPLRAYWLDIGNHRDYKKALEDVKHIQF
jgi:dTDP-glucose pyrophosphorylase